MDNLRVLLGIRRMDRVPNARVRELCRVRKSLDEMINEGILRWFDHVERMERKRERETEHERKRRRVEAKRTEGEKIDRIGSQIDRTTDLLLDVTEVPQVGDIRGPRGKYKFTYL